MCVSWLLNLLNSIDARCNHEVSSGLYFTARFSSKSSKLCPNRPCILTDSCNKQPLFPHTAVTDIRSNRSTLWSLWDRLNYYIYNAEYLFYSLNPSGRNMILGGTTHDLKQISNRGISWRFKSRRCEGLTALPPSCTDCLEILGASTSLSPKDLSRPVMG